MTAEAMDEVLNIVRDWLDAYYGEVEDYGHGNRAMTQLDHGHEEYEARMDVAMAVRSLFLPASGDQSGDQDAEAVPE